jgi:protein phosphatase PTC1
MTDPTEPPIPQHEDLEEAPKYKLTYSVGVAENVNKKYRPTMEDVHTYVENFAERLDWGYFAIFDGHAGKDAAKWCGQHLHTLIGDKIIKDENKDVREVLNESFVKADEEIVHCVKGSSGCTAAVAIIRWELPEESDESRLSLNQHKRMLYTANVGDSRIVLFRSGKAIRLTYDHKASDKLEIKRIEQHGGIIMKNRVNGMLAVTRSLGDQFFKDLVIGNPYTTSVELDMVADKFLIIACDGLWDVISDQKACELVKDVEDANVAAKMLVDCAMKKQTTDNVTVMVIRLGT